jgi:ribulose-phosphate 3-epimerase
LACDFARLGEEIRRVEDAGADWLHVDVMDGHFVPNLTVGPAVVQCMKRVARLPLDVHLMLNHPDRYIETFVTAGADCLTVHAEAEGDVGAMLRKIRGRGVRAGLSVKPATGLTSFETHRDWIDVALVMSVEPGFGGQSFISGSEEKIKGIRRILGGEVDVAVDGGITVENADLVREAGVSVIVAGTAVFCAADVSAAIRSLRGP